MLWLWIALLICSSLWLFGAITESMLGHIVVSSLVVGISLQLIVFYFKG